jgi:RNA polymerase sigma factor (sigma-70 family)
MNKILNSMNSLKLNNKQENEFNQYTNIIKKICIKYANFHTMTTVDDLIQNSSIKLIYSIKNEKCKNIKNKKQYYMRLIKNSCIDMLRSNKNKDQKTTSYENYIEENGIEPLSEYFDIEKIIIDKEYIKNIFLYIIKDEYERNILKHFYGIGTYPKTSKEIGEILCEYETTIRFDKSYIIKKIRKKIIQ